ncbi:hypothetical protein TNCV_2755591 [Trichonephila clavipes]|nr:hypothetical protein TNCV_2755591 [Trichonephila clavipes]
MVNHHRAWSRKLCLVGENRDNSSHREDYEPNEETDQTNASIWRVEETCKYENFPLIPELLQGIPTTVHQNLWFMPDGARTHFSIAVYNHLHGAYSRVGRGEPVAWSPHSPDLNPFDFFWRHLKSLVYEVIGEDLMVQVVFASAGITSTLDLFERVQQSFVGVGCAMTYAAASLNNSCDNPLLHF